MHRGNSNGSGCDRDSDSDSGCDAVPAHARVQACSPEVRLRGHVHARVGQAGFVPHTKRTYVQCWADVWRVLRTSPPPAGAPCGGRVHGWWVPAADAVILRGRGRRTYWVHTAAVSE